MDDDDTMQCQLDLMHALQNRAPLRRVDPEERPLWVGGLKTCPSPTLVGLQAEFLHSSLVMQMRLRPQIERMTEVKARCLHSEQWQSMRNDLRAEVKRRAESPIEARMVYQLERVVKEMPGWVDLQKEVRESDPGQILQPVQSDGFYVVKVLPNKDGVFTVL